MNSQMERIRREVKREVDAKNLSRVAQEVGAAPMTLRLFVSGSSPLPATKAKLVKWYESRAAGRAAAARAFAQELFAGFPEAARGESVGAFVEFVTERYRRQGQEPPDWLAGV
jgi:hypothetical protein